MSYYIVLGSNQSDRIAYPKVFLTRTSAESFSYTNQQLKSYNPVITVGDIKINIAWLNNWKDWKIRNNYKEENNMKTGEYVVATVKNEDIIISESYYKYADIIIARKEAEQLAKKYPDCEFIVLEVKGTCKASSVIWK